MDKNNTRISLGRSRANQTRIMDTKKMKQLQDLLDWLDSFEKLPFEPTRQNVVEKIWQLQSEIKREQLNLHNVMDRLPEDTVIRDNAREMDEKEFEHWWWETVYKGN